MKKALIILLSLLSFSNTPAQTADTLTNETIIKLAKSGFGPEIIRSKISTSPAKFDVSVEGLIGLKENNIPEDIIELMIKFPRGFATPGGFKSDNNSRQAVNTGIYFIKSKTETIEMMPSFIDKKKTNRTAQYLVSDLFNANVRVILEEEHATFEIPIDRPIFQFVFDTLKGYDENSWFGKLSTPKDFLIIKFRSVNKRRELIVGKSSGLRDKVEINEAQKIAFNFKQTGPGIFEVSPATSLDNGEYGIIFSKSNWESQSGRVYDFRIKRENNKVQITKDPA